MAKPTDLIWVTWENHRRSRELASALGVPLFIMIHDGSYFTKVLLLSVRTVGLLIRLRPHGVIVQNPSMALTTLVCFLRPIFGYKVIVDRHSNFKLETRNSRSLKYKIFHRLSRYTVRRADLTLVTNSYLRDLVENWGGRGFVLQDTLPKLRCNQPSPPRPAGEYSVVYICSFSEDEPVDEVLEAARRLENSTVVHVTGNGGRYMARRRLSLPGNVVLTGFLPERDFLSLLSAADAIMVLTKKEHLLLCGAYEAVSLEKPVILSDTRCLREYFRDGPVYSLNSANDITRAIQSAITDKRALTSKIRALREELEVDWASRFQELTAALGNL